MRQSYHGPSTPPQGAPLVDFRPRLRGLGAGLLLALGLATGSAQGQTGRPAAGYFQPDAAARTAAATSPLAATLVRSRAFTLNEAGLRAALATAPLEGQAGAAPLVLALPQPDGSSARFALREAPVMEAGLAARYPMIKTYAGIGLDDATATVRVDLTPAGFHAQVLSSSGSGFLVDPAILSDTRHVLSYYQKDVRASASKMAQCGVVTTPAEGKASAARVAAWRAGGGSTAARSSGAQLRTYRFALTSTPGFSAVCGNTKAGVLAVQVAFVNRMTGIMERELAVRLVLVANNDRITFLNGTGPQPPVPYSDADGYLLPRQNQQNVDQLIGDANYDLGLVLGREPIGGAALLGSLCQSGIKATNFVGCPDPSNYQQLFGYSGHELGHVLGASHSFNTDYPQRGVLSAWEVGSGMTFMSYCGLIGPNQDVQRNSEFVYHTGSYEEIQSVVSTRSGGTRTATGNSAPVVAAPASGKTLPANTPFQLTATATDAENDPLTYSWEQLDLGPAGNLTMPQVTDQTPPLFRFWLPVSSPTRYFPRLAELVNNTAPLGERLPTVTRTLKFRCTARDQHNGTAGLIGGVGLSDLVTLSVSAAAGPFLVTAPNAAGLSWAAGSTQTVTWNVANTNTAPVSCTKVNLRLSLDGGLSYPTLLASNVDNSGSASITVPNVASTTARVMVEADDNYFFDISNADFAITPGPSGPSVATLLRDCSFAGTAVTLPVGDFTLSQLQARGLLNDDVSSLGVTSGFEVVLFSDDNFQGESVTVVGNEACLIGRSFNDRTSSVRVRPVSTATFYQHCGFGGYAVVLPAAGTYSMSQLQALGFVNDDISSLRVSSGVEVVLYADDNLGGASLLVGTDNSCLIGAGFNDRVSSVLVRNAANARASAPAPTVAELVASLRAPLSLNVYPNPVADELLLGATQSLSGSQFEVLDAQGRTQLKGAGETGRLDVSALPAGVYTLRVLREGQPPVTTRFVK